MRKRFLVGLSSVALVVLTIFVLFFTPAFAREVCTYLTIGEGWDHIYFKVSVYSNRLLLAENKALSSDSPVPFFVDFFNAERVRLSKSELTEIILALDEVALAKTNGSYGKVIELTDAARVILSFNGQEYYGPSVSLKEISTLIGSHFNIKPLSKLVKVW